MEIKLELFAEEIIKPSSPTPLHLQKLQFSLNDQNQITVSMPFVLFFQKSNNFTNFQRSNLLKQSLSKALTIFYPLAGRITNNSIADCNDEGALFIEAKANCELSYILRHRNQYHNHTKKFIPLQPEKGIRQYGSLFQITYFNCGGLAVSFAMPHMLGDALSQLIFLNSWGAIARGNTVEMPPFDTSSIFPPRKIPGFDISQWVFKENLVTKSFVFDAFTISAIRDKYSDSHGKLSRVQALSVFILRRIMATGISKSNKFVVFNALNVRSLVDPPISKRLFGNLALPTAAVIDIGKEDEIPRKIRDSIKSMDAECVKKFQMGGELNFLNETGDWLKGEVDKFTFTSLCNFPIYDVDFGWGNPEWVTLNGMVLDNVIMFVDTKEGRGIEAWINMNEQDMAKFEKDELLISHLSSTSNWNQNFSSRL